MLDKLKSRKWWLTFGSLVVMLFAEQLGIDLSWEQIAGIVSTVTGYNLGQGYADGQKERANGGYSADRSVDPAKVKIPKGGDAVRRPSATPTPDPDA